MEQTRAYSWAGALKGEVMRVIGKGYPWLARRWVVAAALVVLISSGGGASGALTLTADAPMLAAGATLPATARPDATSHATNPAGPSLTAGGTNAISTTFATSAGKPRDTAWLGPPVTQTRCPDLHSTVSVFHPGGVPVKDWLEELAFDGHGGMWVSPINQNFVERFDATGALTKTVPVPGPGGLILGPDGLIYVNISSGPSAPGVMRFDPTQINPVPQLFVSGLPGVNGDAFDGAGNLYVSTEDQPPSVLRIRPDGTRDAPWEQAAAFYGANGLAVDGPNLFASVTFDQRSPIEIVPIADPAAHRVFANLSLGVLSRQPAVYPPELRAPLVPKGLDDMTFGPDRKLYVAGFSSGELLRVDPRTAKACVVESGLTTPTAVQFAVGFGVFDPATDLFITEASGRIVHVHLDD